MILAGRSGTGKNHLAIAIIMAVMQQGYRAVLIPVSQLIQRIRATWAHDVKETEEEIIRKFIDIDLLVIDEIGRQSGSQNEKNLLFQVVDGRYRLVRPTIIISNYSPQKIEQKIGTATYDRLREGGGQLLNFTWDSYRC
jgi:DNA replication protein DnaC